MKITWRTGLGILLVGLILMVGFLLRSVILEDFVKPIALLLWTGNRLLASVDQIVYWIGLLLAALFVTFVRMAIHALQPTDPAMIHYTSANTVLKKVVEWRTTILLTHDETDQPNHLRRSLLNLLKDVYASKRPNLVPREVYEAFEKGDIPLPQQIRTFFFLNPAPNTRPSLLQRLSQFSQVPGKWVRHWKKQDIADYYSSIDEVISFMEQQLESEDDK